MRWPSVANSRATAWTGSTRRLPAGRSPSLQARELIADIVAPRIKVPKQSDKYRIFGKNTWMIVHESRWAPGAIPNAITIRWSEDTFYADIRKLRGLVLDTERATRTTTGSISSSRRRTP
jgi:hypothetical protein